VLADFDGIRSDHDGQFIYHSSSYIPSLGNLDKNNYLSHSALQTIFYLFIPNKDFAKP